MAFIWRGFSLLAPIAQESANHVNHSRGCKHDREGTETLQRILSECATEQPQQFWPRPVKNTCREKDRERTQAPSMARKHRRAVVAGKTWALGRDDATIRTLRLALSPERPE